MGLQRGRIAAGPEPIRRMSSSPFRRHISTQEFSLDPSLETCSKTIYVRAPWDFVTFISNTLIAALPETGLSRWKRASIIPYYLSDMEKELTDTELEEFPLYSLYEDSSLFDFFPSFLYVPGCFDPYTHYYFKIYYKGRESNILHIPDDGHDLPTVTYVDGNRDGGDSEQQTKPPITQPAPDIPGHSARSGYRLSGSAAVPETEPFFTGPQDIQGACHRTA